MLYICIVIYKYKDFIMVKNKEELLSESNKWSLLAINEVKNLVENLMESEEMDEELVAELLGWKLKKVNACLDGDGDLRISDLAKLLIANDLVLEVKPSSETDICYGTPDEDDEDDREWDEDETEEEPDDRYDNEGKEKPNPISQLKIFFESLPENATLEDVLKKAINAFTNK